MELIGISLNNYTLKGKTNSLDIKMYEEHYIDENKVLHCRLSVFLPSLDGKLHPLLGNNNFRVLDELLTEQFGHSEEDKNLKIEGYVSVSSMTNMGIISLDTSRYRMSRSEDYYVNSLTDILLYNEKALYYAVPDKHVYITVEQQIILIDISFSYNTYARTVFANIDFYLPTDHKGMLHPLLVDRNKRGKAAIYDNSNGRFYKLVPDVGRLNSTGNFRVVTTRWSCDNIDTHVVGISSLKTDVDTHLARIFKRAENQIDKKIDKWSKEVEELAKANSREVLDR